MLRPDVVEAVRRGLFNVWAISTVDEGLEILTGLAAGRPDEKGVFPAGTINGRVAARLQGMAEIMRKYQEN